MPLDNTRRAELEKLLDAIEQEMRTIGYWSEVVQDPFAKLPPGEPRVYINASSFEAWLQFVFLPNARQAVAAGDLPARSQVGLMAMRQYDYHSYVPEAQRLVELLQEFDRLVEGAV